MSALSLAIQAHKGAPTVVAPTLHVVTAAQPASPSTAAAAQTTVAPRCGTYLIPEARAFTHTYIYASPRVTSFVVLIRHTLRPVYRRVLSCPVHPTHSIPHRPRDKVACSFKRTPLCIFTQATLEGVYPPVSSIYACLQFLPG